MGIIESYVSHPVLLIFLHKALRRTETRGGLFYDYFEKGIPKGSPLSLFLGAIALIPLDKAIAAMQSILTHLLSLAAQKPDIFGVMRRYIEQWIRWYQLGLSTIHDFETCLSTHLPSIFSCWIMGAGKIDGNCI